MTDLDAASPDTRIFSSAGELLPEVDRRRPLIVCDIDEVVLSFIAELERWLTKQDLWLARDGFALNGNIRHKNGAPVETDSLRELLHGFFATQAHDLPALPGAIQALQSLATHGTILFLSNLPIASAAARRANLDRLDLRHPLIVNEGPKGPPLARLCSGMEAPVVFLDDSPSNIGSVLYAAPDVDTVHFIPDARFRAQVEPKAGTGLFTGDWSEAARYITGKITPPDGLTDP